jgi:hypothetical protein
MVRCLDSGTTSSLTFTVETRLSDLNGTKGRLDNQKCQIIRKTNEKDEGKYQLTFYSVCDIIKLKRKYNIASNEKSCKQK